VSYLSYRSGYVPRPLAVLLGLAGAGYAFDSVAAVLYRESAPVVSSVTFVGELLLTFWLLGGLRPSRPGRPDRR
jgi:hypothetical protein